MPHYFLGSIVFISGAVVMTLELVGSRVMAPFVGSSTIVWTSLIGIVLASLSVGYVWGGRIADRGIKAVHLAYVFLVSSFCVGMITFLPYLFSTLLYSIGFEVFIVTVILTILLFTPATVLLGMVTPFALKLKVSDITQIGRDAGGLYALSTMGSIVGTFLGGLVLISFFGTNQIIIGCAIVLCMLGVSILLIEKRYSSALFLSVVFLGALFSFSSFSVNTGLLADIDTRYSRFWIQDIMYKNEPTRILSNGADIVQSGIFLEKPHTLMSVYTRAFDITETIVPNPKQALLLGAGVFIQPKHFLRRNPEAVIDVVDIDEKLEEISKKYFGYIPDSRIQTIITDARVFLNSSDKTYDVVYVDVYPSYLSIPPHLATQETVQAVESRLKEDGVVVANVIGRIEGRGSEFISNMYETYKSVFPVVRVFQVVDRPLSDIQNILILAYRNDVGDDERISVDDDIAEVLSREFVPEEGGLVMTDNFAPLERILFRMQM